MKHLAGIIVLVTLFCTGCLAPEPIIIIQTRLIDAPSPAALPASPIPVSTMETEKATPVVQATQPPPSQTIRILFAPDREAASSDIYSRFTDALSGYANGPVDYHVSEDEVMAVEALCSSQADMAWLSTPAYILANQRCGVTARYRGLRSGWAYYRGQIMVQTDQLRTARDLKPISSLADLGGATLGFTEPQSTSGYLFPKALLLEIGVEPSEEVFLAGDGQAVLAVYKGEVDAAASYWAPPAADGSIGDARALIEDTYGDVESVVDILYLSSPIPNDPVVLRGDLADDLETRLVLALLRMAQSQEGREILRELYGLEGLVPTNDGDYEGVREMGEALGVEFAQLLRGD